MRVKTLAEAIRKSRSYASVGHHPHLYGHGFGHGYGYGGYGHGFGHGYGGHGWGHGVNPYTWNTSTVSDVNNPLNAFLTSHINEEVEKDLAQSTQAG